MHELGAAKPTDGVVHVIQNGRAVLLDTERGIYFGLNRIGADVWTALLRGEEVDDIVTMLAADYERSVAEISPDILAFLDALEGHGLVKRNA